MLSKNSFWSHINTVFYGTLSKERPKGRLFINEDEISSGQTSLRAILKNNLFQEPYSTVPSAISMRKSLDMEVERFCLEFKE